MLKFKVLINKALTYSFLSFGLIPVLPTRILGLPVVLFVLAVLISFFSHKISSLQWKKLLLITLPYLLFSLSVFYSENMADAIRKLVETRLSLFVVPFCFFLLNSKSIKLLEDKKWLLKKTFVLSTFIFCFIYFINLFFIPNVQDSPFGFPSGFFFKNALYKISFIEYEPVYLSFVITISIIFLNELLSHKKLKLVYVILFSVFFFGVIFVMVSKLAIIFLMIFLFWYIFNQIKKISLRIFIGLGLAIATLFIAKIPAIDYEIREVQYFFKGQKLARDDTADIRNKIIMSSIELASKTNPFFGIGIGDTQKELNKIYSNRGYNELLEKKFDTHNQYLSTYISTGIIGLLGLLLVFLFCLVLCIKYKSWYLTWVLVFLFFQMLTECILERQLTVIIFSIITSIIVFFPNRISVQKNKY